MKQSSLLYAKYTAFIITLLLLLHGKAHAQIIVTIAGNGSGAYNGDSILSTQAQFLPIAIAIDKAGNLYISDLDDSRVRKIDRNGIITTVAGNGVRGFRGDGKLAVDASLNYNWGIAIDPALNLFIVDDGESRIRKVTTDGIINTIAGIDTVNGGGYNGDSILAINARFTHPACIALDATGNLYISDQGERIRKIDTNGMITTIAGTGESGYSGDGGLAVNAMIGDPIGIVTDKKGNVYFTDVDYHVVRKIDNNGIITTVAGNGSAGYTGDGGSAKSATLNFPYGLAVAGNGTLLIADVYNHAIRQVDTTGIITTVIGDGSAGFSGDGGPAKNAKLNFPAALAFDNAGDLLIADYGNARIRKVISVPLPVSLIAFDAILLDNSIKISWKTAAEENAAYFNVQRSSNGNDFTTIGKVSAAGNSSTVKNYHFTDEGTISLQDNMLYYRLQSIDRNGSIHYGKTVGVKLQHTGSITLYPNPANDMLNIKMSSRKKEPATIQITDLQGRVVKELTVQLYAGLNNISINIAMLAKGGYTIKIKGATTPYTPFVKL